MNNFSFLQTLNLDEPVKEVVAEVVTEVAAEPELKSYHIYLIESERGNLKIGVPVEKVAEFDNYFNDSPEKLSTIEEQLVKFDAVILE